MMARLLQYTRKWLHKLQPEVAQIIDDTQRSTINRIETEPTMNALPADESLITLWPLCTLIYDCGSFIRHSLPWQLNGNGSSYWACVYACRKLIVGVVMEHLDCRYAAADKMPTRLMSSWTDNYDNIQIHPINRGISFVLLYCRYIKGNAHYRVTRNHQSKNKKDTSASQMEKVLVNDICVFVALR